MEKKRKHFVKILAVLLTLAVVVPAVLLPFTSALSEGSGSIDTYNTGDGDEYYMGEDDPNDPYDNNNKEHWWIKDPKPSGDWTYDPSEMYDLPYDPSMLDSDYDDETGGASRGTDSDVDGGEGALGDDEPGNTKDHISDRYIEDDETEDVSQIGDNSDGDDKTYYDTSYYANNSNGGDIQHVIMVGGTHVNAIKSSLTNVDDRDDGAASHSISNDIGSTGDYGNKDRNGTIIFSSKITKLSDFNKVLNLLPDEKMKDSDDGRKIIAKCPVIVWYGEDDLGLASVSGSERKSNTTRNPDYVSMFNRGDEGDMIQGYVINNPRPSADDGSGITIEGDPDESGLSGGEIPTKVDPKDYKEYPGDVNPLDMDSDESRARAQEFADGDRSLDSPNGNVPPEAGQTSSDKQKVPNATDSESTESGPDSHEIGPGKYRTDTDREYIRPGERGKPGYTGDGKNNKENKKGYVSEFHDSEDEDLALKDKVIPTRYYDIEDPDFTTKYPDIDQSEIVDGGDTEGRPVTKDFIENNPIYSQYGEDGSEDDNGVPTNGSGGKVTYVGHVSITNPSSGLESAFYDGAGLGHALSGFDYQVIVSSQMSDQNGNPMYVQIPDIEDETIGGEELLRKHAIKPAIVPGGTVDDGTGGVSDGEVGGEPADTGTGGFDWYVDGVDPDDYVFSDDPGNIPFDYDPNDPTTWRVWYTLNGKVVRDSDGNLLDGDEPRDVLAQLGNNTDLSDYFDDSDNESGGSPKYYLVYGNTDSDGNTYVDDDGNPLSVPEIHRFRHKGYKNDLYRPIMQDSSETVHVTGYIEKWKEKGAKVYVAGVGPMARKDAENADKYNYDCELFNSALKGTLSDAKFINGVFEWILDMRPYFDVGGTENKDPESAYKTDKRESSKGRPWYDKTTFRNVMYMFWTTMYVYNPPPEPAKIVDQTLYSVTASLTSYTTNMLSYAAEKRADDMGTKGKKTAVYHEPQEINSSVVHWTSAGSFLGYGDKFKPYMFRGTGYLASETRASSAASYKALKTVGSGEKLYKYARYGRLLTDLGLDSTGFKSSVQAEGWIPGIVMWFLYLMSAAAPLIFNFVIWLLKVLNPFQIFSIGGLLAKGENIPAAWQWVANNDAIRRVLEVCGQIYNAAYDIGVLTVIPLTIAVLFASLLMRPDSSTGNWPKIRKFVVRFVVIIVGVPILGSVYAAVLDKADEVLAVRDFAPTSMVVGNFVDFENWARKARLTPAEGMILVSEGTDAGGGRGSVSSVRSLRKTAYTLNSKLGVLNLGTGSKDDLLNGIDHTDGIDMTSKALENSTASKEIAEPVSSDVSVLENVLGFVFRYTLGDFYTAGAFEGESMSALMNAANVKGTDNKIKMGRRATLDEMRGKKGTKMPDNNGSLYEFFDLTNEYEDWTKRPQNDSLAIVTSSKVKINGVAKDGAKDYSPYGLFNFISNGGSNISADLDSNDNITFTGTYDGGNYISPGAPLFNKAGNRIDRGKTRAGYGLSTLSMYNYLTTTFKEGGIEIFSTMLAASNLTGAQHYSVSMIGSGWIRIAYYFNSFAVLFAMCIMGFVYGFHLLINNAKRCFEMIGMIPLMTVGIMSAIVKVFVTFVMMIAEIIITLLIFSVISDFVIGLTGLIEKVLSSLIESPSGVPAVIGAVNSGMVYNSYFGVVLSNMVMGVLMLVYSGIALAYAEAFVRVWDKVVRLIYELLGFRSVKTVPVSDRVFEKIPYSQSEVPVLE